MNEIINRKLVPSLALVALLLTPSASSAVVGVDLETGADFSVTSSDTSTSSSAQTGADVDVDLGIGAQPNSGITSSAQVGSEVELEAFVEAIPEQKPLVSDVEAEVSGEGDSEIFVAYKHRGKLLGFIPVTYKTFTTVVVNADASVEVRSRPSAWAFLVVKEDYSRANLESEIRSRVSAEAAVSGEVDARARARIVEAVVAELEAHTSASVATN